MSQVPEYKSTLFDELKVRLGQATISHVAAKSAYSDRYVREWFKNHTVNDTIRIAAMNLLRELKAEEQAQLEAVQSI